MTRDVRKTGKDVSGKAVLGGCSSGAARQGGVKKLPRLRRNFRLSSFEWMRLVRRFTI